MSEQNLILSPALLTTLLTTYADHRASTKRGSTVSHAPKPYQTTRAYTLTTHLTCSCGWRSNEVRQNLTSNMIVGSISAGIGARPLNKILSAANLPGKIKLPQ